MFCNASLYESKYMVYNKANVSKLRCHLLSSTWLKHSKWGRSKTCPMEMGGASIPISTRERLLGNIRIHHQYIELARVQRKSVLQLTVQASGRQHLLAPQGSKLKKMSGRKFATSYENLVATLKMLVAKLIEAI